MTGNLEKFWVLGGSKQGLTVIFFSNTAGELCAISLRWKKEHLGRGHGAFSQKHPETPNSHNHTTLVLPRQWPWSFFSLRGNYLSHFIMNKGCTKLATS